MIEQCANFKVRHAAAEWLAFRVQSSGDLEAQRTKHIKTIKKAIVDLRLLSKHGTTEERLISSGGLLSASALVQTEPLSALSNMAQYYKKAFEFKNRRSKAYAWTNWATAELLASRLNKDNATQRTEILSRIEADAPRLREVQAKESEAKPNFWNYAYVADIDFVRLIATCPIDASAEAEPLNKAAASLKNEVIEGYRSAISRGASPRQTGTLIENLDFVIEIIGNREDPLMEAVQAIRDALPLADAHAPDLGVLS